MALSGKDKHRGFGEPMGVSKEVPMYLAKDSPWLPLMGLNQLTTHQYSAKKVFMA